MKDEYRKEELIYVCNRLWLSSDLQHVDNLVVSNQLVYSPKPLIRLATRVQRGCHVKDEYRKEELIYVCNRLWLSSDLQHVDNLVVSNQLVFPNK